MIVSVRVRRGNSPPELKDGILVISTTEEFEKGQANRDVLRQIGEYYGVKAQSVAIRSGFTSRRKVVEVSGK